MNYHQAIDLLNKAKSFTGNENFEEIAKLLRLYEKSREASSFVFCAYPQSGDLYAPYNGKTLEEKTKRHLARTKEAIESTFNNWKPNRRKISEHELLLNWFPPSEHVAKAAIRAVMESDEVRGARAALQTVAQFIQNGVECGFIQIPDGDPAKDTLPLIYKALSQLEASHAD